MKTARRSAFLTFVLLHMAAAGALFGEEGIELKVSAVPPLPAADYLKGAGSFESDQPLQVIIKRGKPENTTLASEGAAGTAHSIKVDGGHAVAGFHIFPVKLPRGREMIISMYIKGCFGLKASPGLGLGFEVVEELGSKQVGLCSAWYAPEAGKENTWYKLVSKPFKLTETWDTPCYVVIKNWWGNGGGLVDEIRITDAVTELSIAAKSNAGIREVTVADDNGKEVFNSGVMKEGQKEFVRKLNLSTGFVYTITAGDYSGDVQKQIYPQSAEK